jgi:hypothetical protein
VLINGAVLLSFFPGVITIGDVVACLGLLVGIYVASKLITHRVSQEETPSRRKSILSYTALGIVFRVLIMAIFDYTLLRYPIIGLSLSESVIIAIIPPIALFNATEPLYVVPLGYFIARTINKNLKVGNNT